MINRIRYIMKINILAIFIANIIHGVFVEHVVHTNYVLMCGIGLSYLEVTEDTKRAFWIYVSALFINFVAGMSSGLGMLNSILSCGVEMQGALVVVLLVEGIFSKVKFGSKLRRENRTVLVVAIGVISMTIIGSYIAAFRGSKFEIANIVATLQTMLPLVIIIMLYLSSDVCIPCMMVYSLLYIYTIASSIESYSNDVCIIQSVSCVSLIVISGLNVYETYVDHNAKTVDLKMVSTINEKIRDFSKIETLS